MSTLSNAFSDKTLYDPDSANQGVHEAIAAGSHLHFVAWHKIVSPGVQPGFGFTAGGCNKGHIFSRPILPDGDDSTAVFPHPFPVLLAASSILFSL